MLSFFINLQIRETCMPTASSQANGTKSTSFHTHAVRMERSELHVSTIGLGIVWNDLD